MKKRVKRKADHKVFNHDNLISHIDNQKVLEKVLYLSRSQAWHLFTGKSKLSPAYCELLMLSLDIHPTHQLTKKV